ncbi:hypothetical protein ASPBRDRAFT_165067 [Aspergillus brasiliensis CBS 101740]|uniref:C2H2-type domain-containing protein n=1 Tax=Aspergillus brasiliensis (strain CBS 101740 / IMI 381727 / IBT 21946) TaxID=767769 RepID=A0A1L9U1D0_ASPBC|nr:hypothetical protein ASPBRDRAFT_165067 [Aspergillus brasiliensis CBS 101740]
MDSQRQSNSAVESMLCQWNHCGQVFGTPLDLWIHMEQRHVPPSRYECSSCNIVLGSCQQAHLHAVSHHEIEVSNKHTTYRDGEECFLDFLGGPGSKILCSFLIFF